MNRFSWLLVFLVPVAVLPVNAWLAADDAPRFEPGRTHLPASAVEVEMEFVDRLPLVNATINGRGPYLFILDTGASMVALNRPLARALKLKTHKSASVGDNSGAGAHTAAIVELGSLELGQARFARVEAVVVDLGFVVGGHRTIDGLLGFGLFADCLLTIDYPANAIRLEHGALRSDRGKETLRYASPQGFPILTLRVADRTVRLAVDSGANGCLTVPRHLRKKLPFRAPPVAMGNVQRATAEHAAELARVAGPVKIGRHLVSDPLVRLVGGSGVLGNQVLQHFAVTFDQKNTWVRFVREGEEPITIPGVRSRGFYTQERNGVQVVVEVIADTGAARAGIKVRDRVIRVNGRPVGELGRDEWAVLWNSDHPLQLTFRRRKETFEVTVPMVELVP